MSDSPLEFVSIVPEDTPLGRRLSSFTRAGLEKLFCAEFEGRFSTKVCFEKCDDEPSVYDSVWLDFPRFEITFTPQLLHEFEQLAFEIGPSASST